MTVRDVKELTLCKKAYRLAMDFFEISKMLQSMHEFPNP